MFNQIVTEAIEGLDGQPRTMGQATRLRTEIDGLRSRMHRIEQDAKRHHAAAARLLAGLPVLARPRRIAA